MKYDSFKHHRRSLRLKGYDYSSPGAYYVKICAKDRGEIFGKIDNGEMVLNDFGKIAKEELELSSIIRKELTLNCFVIMPNHIHMIVEIVGATGRSPLHDRSASKGPAPKSIGSFIAGFKSAATKRINGIRKMPGFPIWQRNFYDHIIRDEDEMNQIRQYIRTNPQNWAIDTENPDFHTK